MDATTEQIVRLSRLLRANGIEVSMAETVDAAEAARTIGLLDRSLFREALRSCMCKVTDDERRFDAAFDRCFPLTRSGAESTVDVRSSDALAAALADGDDLGPIAGRLVDEYGGLDGSTRGERHHLQRVLRAADLAALMALALRHRPDTTSAELRARIDELHRLLAGEVRARLSFDDSVPDRAENLEFLNASRTQLEAMRRAVRPLARRIATRLARRRQHLRSGRINLRRTMRHSLDTGGVPVQLSHQRRRPARPELWVLCDISGSVAEFSLFTLTLLAALATELPHTRSFVFVDAIDEITDLLEHNGHRIEPWQLMRNTNVIGATGHSDYGAVLEQFWSGPGRQQLTGRTTVVIVGDGRNNRRPPRAEILAEIARRSRAVYWLNPEPHTEWGESDSEMAAYSPHCRKVFEVRDLEQLARCVEMIV